MSIVVWLFWHLVFEIDTMEVTGMTQQKKLLYRKMIMAKLLRAGRLHCKPCQDWHGFGKQVVVLASMPLNVIALVMLFLVSPMNVVGFHFLIIA